MLPSIGSQTRTIATNRHGMASRRQTSRATATAIPDQTSRTSCSGRSVSGATNGSTNGGYRKGGSTSGLVNPSAT